MLNSTAKYINMYGSERKQGAKLTYPYTTYISRSFKNSVSQGHILKKIQNCKRIINRRVKVFIKENKICWISSIQSRL